MGNTVQHIENLMAIDKEALLTVVMICAVEVIGICQWIKNFAKNKKGRFYATISALVLLPCAWVHTPLVSPAITVLFDIYFLSLAVLQLAWEVIAKALPNAVGAIFEKVFSMGKQQADNKGQQRL